MRVAYRRSDEPLAGPLLVVTHSDRRVELDRCGLNYLTRRYANPDRLSAPPPFAELKPSAKASPHLGQVTIWRFLGGDFRQPQLVAHLVPDPEPGSPGRYKPQHAVWKDGRLWVVGVEQVQVFDARLSLVRTLTDPWMAGGHTINADGGGAMISTWSGSDSVIVIDAETFAVKHAWRLPEALYGRNYPLSRTDSVVDHFVPNDLQLTHVNAAWPHNGGVLVSMLIQGAIGWFSPRGEYRELLRGYVACHGVRASRRGQVYFSDSCLGTINFLDETYRVESRLDLDSRWLHDAEEVAPDLFAACVADRNTVEIVDRVTAKTRHVIAGHEFGESTQFVSYGE